MLGEPQRSIVELRYVLPQGKQRGGGREFGGLSVLRVSKQLPASG